MILQPMHVNYEKGMEYFVNKDFAKMFWKEDLSNPCDCLLCIGYMVKYSNCPIIWKSKMQSSIAQSTMEAKYMAPLFVKLLFY
jgi:hypothetical protein